MKVTSKLPMLMVAVALMLLPALGRAAEMPTLISATTYTVGSTGYTISIGLCKAIEEKGGVKVKVVPAGTDIAKLLPVKSQEASFSILTGAGQFMASRGLQLFAAPNMGPQRLRLVWACNLGAIAGMMTRADSGIKTLADLKGKRVAFIPGSPACTFLHGGYLAFGGLEWKDVEKIKVSSWKDAWKSVLEGSSDTAHCLITSSAAMELAASPNGIHWLPAPAQDKEGWKRLNSWCPYLRPYKADKGAGITPQNPAEIASYDYGFVGYPHLDPKLAEVITTSILNGYDIYQDMHAALKAWTREAALNNQAFVVPYHRGSVAAFKAAGLWTAEHEKIQQDLLKQEEQRLAGYAAAQKLAKEKGVEQAQWPAFWEDYAREHQLF
ncbi:MAG: TAXI family TRAP transporter solute-binding subunit [Pseudomonadota bacterium]